VSAQIKLVTALFSDIGYLVSPAGQLYEGRSGQQALYRDDLPQKFESRM